MPQKSIEVLISCMCQDDATIAKKINISSDAVIVNQCGRNEYTESFVNEHKVRMYSCMDRGLSKSRNTALSNSTSDICLLCDDDEYLENDYVAKIHEGYSMYPDAAVIAFELHRPRGSCWKTSRKLGRFSALRISSCQITFKRELIKNSAIKFNEAFGAGTQFSSGEEMVFLHDCLFKGLNVYYVPLIIGSVTRTQSTWFKGFTESYFVNRGVVTRFSMGLFFATLYSMYFSVTKYPIYRESMTFLKAFRLMLRGIYSTKIERPLQLLN